MEDIGNPFKAIAPIIPIPVGLDHVILENAKVPVGSEINVITTN